MVHKRVVYGPTSDLGKAFGSGDILSMPIGDLSITGGAPIDPALGNALNDVLFANAASGTTNLSIGAVTMTAPYTVHFSGTRGVAGTAGTDITGTASVGLNGLVATGSASVSNVATKANDSAISITTTASGTWNGVEVFDNS